MFMHRYQNVVEGAECHSVLEEYQEVDLLLFTDGGTDQTLFLLMKDHMALVCCFWSCINFSQSEVITAVLLPVMQRMSSSTETA